MKTQLRFHSVVRAEGLKEWRRQKMQVMDGMMGKWKLKRREISIIGWTLQDNTKFWLNHLHTWSASLYKKKKNEIIIKLKLSGKYSRQLIVSQEWIFQKIHPQMLSSVVKSEYSRLVLESRDLDTLQSLSQPWPPLYIKIYLSQMWGYLSNRWSLAKITQVQQQQKGWKTKEWRFHNCWNKVQSSNWLKCCGRT